MAYYIRSDMKMCFSIQLFSFHLRSLCSCFFCQFERIFGSFFSPTKGSPFFLLTICFSCWNKDILFLKGKTDQY